jgi:hypothetical protein
MRLHGRRKEVPSGALRVLLSWPVTGCFFNTVAGTFPFLMTGRRSTPELSRIVVRGPLPAPLPHPSQARPSLFGSA